MPSFGELLASEVPVLVHFFVRGNEGCEEMTPVLQDVANSMGNLIKIVKIDANKNSEITTALRIREVPTLMLYKSGVMIWRQSKLMDSKSLKNVVETLL